MWARTFCRGPQWLLPPRSFCLIRHVGLEQDYQAALGRERREEEARRANYFDRSKAGIKAMFNVTGHGTFPILAELFRTRPGRGQLSGPSGIGGR